MRDLERQLERTGRRRGPALMAVAVRFQPVKRRLRIELASGAAFEVPLSAVAELAGATPSQLLRVDLDRSGTRMCWRDVRSGVDLSVAQLASRVLGDGSARSGGS